MGIRYFNESCEKCHRCYRTKRENSRLCDRCSDISTDAEKRNAELRESALAKLTDIEKKALRLD